VLGIGREGVCSQANSNGFSTSSIGERKGVLSVIPVNQIPLAKRTAGQNLNRVDSTGIRLHDGYELFIGSLLDAQSVKKNVRGLKADGKPRADVAVEVGASAEILSQHNLVPFHLYIPPQRGPPRITPKGAGPG
jgi:hypothetical protein